MSSNNNNNNNNNNLKERIRKKIQAKQQLRNGKKSIMKKREFKVNNNEDIRTCALSLMMDVKNKIKQKPNIGMPALDKIFGKKYDFLKKKYFGVYRAVLAQELPIGVLDMMLSQKTRIDNKEISEKDASMEVGNIIAKKLNVDVDALVKSAEEKKNNK